MPVFKADGFGDIHVVLDQEWRGLGWIENFQLIHQYLDLTGGQLGVDHAVGPGLHPTADAKDEFAAQRVRLGMDVRIDLRVEDDLGNPLPVTKVDENHAAVIPPSQDPAHQDDFFAHILGTQGVAVMGSSHVAEDLSQWIAPFWKMFRSMCPRSHPRGCLFGFCRPCFEAPPFPIPVHSPQR